MEYSITIITVIITKTILIIIVPITKINNDNSKIYKIQ